MYVSRSILSLARDFSPCAAIFVKDPSTTVSPMAAIIHSFNFVVALIFPRIVMNILESLDKMCFYAFLLVINFSRCRIRIHRSLTLIWGVVQSNQILRRRSERIRQMQIPIQVICFWLYSLEIF
jgi:hypothetical protein